MLISTAISTSAVPIQSTTPMSVNNGIVNTVELTAEANIDAPIKTAKAAEKIAVAKPQQAQSTQASNAALAKAALVSGSTKLDAWIDGLIQKESSGKTNIKILDTNNRYSYGCLQFQMPTFIAYGKKYGIISGTEANLESLIMSCSLQRAIAKKMILDDSDNWRHWYHSVYTRGLGLPPLN